MKSIYLYWFTVQPCYIQYACNIDVSEQRVNPLDAVSIYVYAIRW